MTSWCSVTGRAILSCFAGLAILSCFAGLAILSCFAGLAILPCFAGRAILSWRLMVFPIPAPQFFSHHFFFWKRFPLLFFLPLHAVIFSHSEPFQYQKVFSLFPPHS